MFSNGTVAAQARTQQVRRDLVLELLHPVDGDHRNPHAVAADQLRVGVDVDHLQGEPRAAPLGREHRRRRLAEVAPRPRVEGDPPLLAGLGGGTRPSGPGGAAPARPPAHGWRSRGGAPPAPGAPAAGRGPGSGAEARRKPTYITVAPRASPSASLSLALAKANTPPAAASSTPAAISRLPSKRGRSSRRPLMARPLATAPPTTTT